MLYNVRPITMQTLARIPKTGARAMKECDQSIVNEDTFAFASLRHEEEAEAEPVAKVEPGMNKGKYQASGSSTMTLVVMSAVAVVGAYLLLKAMRK